MSTWFRKFGPKSKTIFWVRVLRGWRTDWLMVGQQSVSRFGELLETRFGQVLVRYCRVLQVARPKDLCLTWCISACISHQVCAGVRNRRRHLRHVPLAYLTLLLSKPGQKVPKSTTSQSDCPRLSSHRKLLKLLRVYVKRWLHATSTSDEDIHRAVIWLDSLSFCH